MDQLREHQPLLLQAPVDANRPLPLPGVVILGGAHGALAVARCFGRQNIPVVLVTDDHPLPKFSRYVRESYCWPGATSSQRIVPRRPVILLRRGGCLIAPMPGFEKRLGARGGVSRDRTPGQP